MQRITPFDPTAKVSGTFPVHLPNGGWFVVMNESVVGILLRFGDGSQKVINPFTLRAMRVTSVQANCEWQQDYIITGAQVPNGLNILTGEVYDPAEWTGGEFIIALPRLVNIGNSGGTGGVSTVTNDGNAAATVFVESTAVGSAGSNVKITNDGNVQVSVVSNGALTNVLSIVPGDATHPATVIIHGAADSASSASSVPATGVTAGALPAGVTLPAPQVSAGALPAGVTIGGGQVAGTVANANDASFLTDGTNIGTFGVHDDTPDQMVRLAVAQIASNPRGFGVIAWDGAVGHNAKLVDNAGNRYADAAFIGAGALPAGVTIPGPQVSSAVANATNSSQLGGVAASGYAVVGAHSVGQTIISFGTGVPASLAANEIFVQLS